MKKKVLIISTSLRGGSNSEILAKECEKGAKAAGHDVQFLSLKEKEVKYCIGVFPVSAAEAVCLRMMLQTFWN